MKHTWTNRSTREEQDDVLTTIIDLIIHHEKDEVRTGDIHNMTPTKVQEIIEDLYMGGRIRYGKHGYIPTSPSWRTAFKQQAEDNT